MDQVQKSDEAEILGAGTDKQIAGFRFLLSLGAFVATSVEPVEPEAFFQLTYSALTIYTIYSGLVYCLARNVQTFSPVTAYFSTPQGTQGWNRIALGPLSLVTRCYVLTYWARAEEALKRKLDANGRAVVQIEISL